MDGYEMAHCAQIPMIAVTSCALCGDGKSSRRQMRELHLQAVQPPDPVLAKIREWLR